MGSCLARSSFTVNKPTTSESIRTYPVLFSMSDAEVVLGEADPGTYLLYKDFETDRLYLSVRLNNRIQHHRISEMNRLFYLNHQPYPYLDSIIYYHRRHKLQGIKLQQQAQLSARVVRAFSHKVAAANGNIPATASRVTATAAHTAVNEISRNGSLASLITSSSDSTVQARL